MNQLAGKVAIVSGAVQGIGLACAHILAEHGMTVVGFDINPAITQQANMHAMIADISQRDDVERVVAEAASLGPIAVVVNNAATWRRTPVDSSWEQTLADWDYIMDTNLRGVMLLSRAAVPHLRNGGGGHIINMSTYYVLPARSPGTNQPNTDLYNASKWALNGFTDAWAKYLHKDNIMVNGLCMGATATDMLAGLFPDKKLPPELAEQVMQPQQIAQQMWDVMQSGRTGENFGAWVGEDVTLGELPALHRRITG